MYPFRYSSIFRNRWMALLWAAGICWMAYDVAGSGPEPSSNNAASATDVTGTAYGDDEVAALADSLNQM